VRTITKGPEPASLTQHRQTPHCDYDNYVEKADLRQALVTEQRELCCYCMGRIQDAPTKMRIEHWQAQSRFPAMQLDYRNLLGACLGGEGRPSHLQHCDTRKGDSALQWNPADPAHHIETRIRYEMDGSIRSNEAVFDDQLNDVLNLNLPVLRNNRKGVYDALLEWLRSEKRRNQGPIPRERIERERARLAAGDLAPYGQVAVWLLGQRL
jgi:uncharacterized protein (TIGR02646 family)